MADETQTEQQSPLSFSELVQVHNQLKQTPFFGQMDLPAFSRFMKEQTGTALFDQGLHDSTIKRASMAVDRFLQPAADVAGHAAGSLAEGVGLGQYREPIERAAQGLPRGIVDTIPVIAGSALMAAPDPTMLTKIGGAALLGLGGASAGAKTYEETGSGLAGLISGGAQAAMPAAAKLGENLIGKPLINKFLTTPVAEKIGELGGEAITRVPRFTQEGSGFLASEAAKLAESGLEHGAANLGVIAMNEAAGQAESVAQGNGMYNPFTAEHAAELAAGTLPFAAIDAAMHLHGRLTKDFTSQTSVENAQYLGQVREAQQLANTADAINRFRTTEMLSKGQKLLPESTYGPYTGPEEEPRAAQTKNLLNAPESKPNFIRGRQMGPEVYPPDTLTGIDLRLKEATTAVDTGILTPVEGAQRIENIQKAAAEPPKPVATTAQVLGTEPVAGLKKPAPEVKSLQDTTSPFNAMLGAKEWFSNHFKSLGLPEDAIGRYTDIAEHIAAAFSDVGYTRVGQLVADQANKNGLRGAYFQNTSSELHNAVIGLVSKQKYGSVELDVFKALHTLGHELWHGIQRDAENARLDPVKTFQYNKIAELSAGMEPEDRSRLFMHAVGMMVPERLRSDKEFLNTVMHRAVTNEGDHIEFMADMAGLFTLGMINPDVKSQIKFMRDEMKFSSPLEQQFARALYVPMRDIIGALKEHAEVTSFTNKDRAYQRAAVGQLEQITDNVESILKDQQFTQRAVEALQSIQKNDPAYFEQLRVQAELGGKMKYSKLRDVRSAASYDDDGVLNSAVEMASKALGLTKRREMEKELGLQPRFFEKWFYPFAQLSGAYPQLLGVHNIVRSYSAMANDYLSELMAPFLTKPSKLGHMTLDPEAHGLKKVASNPQEMEALNKVRLISNEVSKAEKRTLTDDELRAALPPELSPEAAGRVSDLFRTLTETVYPKAAEIQVSAAGASVSHAAASTLMGKNATLKWKDALAYGTGIRDVVIDMGNPLKAAEVQQKMQFLQQVVGPQALQSGMNVAKAMLEHVQKLQQMFENNPGYSPETRLGKYLVLWKREGEKTWGSFASDDFLKSKAKLDALRDEGVKVALMKDKTDMGAKTAGMDPDLVERYNAIRSAGEAAAIRELGESTDELSRFREAMSAGEDTIAKEIKARGITQHLLPRKLTEGREDTNAVLGFLNYVSGVAHGVSKAYVREQAGLAFQDPELRSNPKLEDLGRKHLNNVINPTAKEMTALKQLNFGYFMGFNFSNMLLEGAQGVMTFVPQITRDTGSISASYKAWGKAVGTIVEGLTSKDGKVKDPELRAMLDRATKEGRVDAGVMSEFNTLDENLVPNLRALASGSKLSEAGELVKKPVYWYLHAARWLYSHAPRANSQVAFAAAWDIGRNKLKLSPEQAYEYATTTVDRTMFGGGKAGRPVEAFANTGKLQGVVGLMYSLQTYSFSTISMMARLGKDAITQSDRIQPHEKVAARKAFGQMLVTQLALGGALSLPFASGLVAIVDQLFPEAEVKKKLKEAVHNTLDGQDGLTSHLSDIALKGLPDAAGVDLSSRVGLSGVLGVNPYSGFQVGNLVGPIGSVVENVAKAARSASVGDYAQAARTILPTQYRNVLALAQDNGEVKDAQGRLLYQPTDVEKLLLAGGFRPTSVTDRQEAAQMEERANQSEAARLGRFHKGLADQLLQGQVGEVREQLLNAQKENSLYDARAGARRVVEMAQAATNPVDPARSGPQTAAQSRTQIASMYGIPPGPTEQQLLLQRKSLERTLQIPGAGQMSPTEVFVARTVDYLMSLDPSLPRQAARKQAERLLGHGIGPRL